MPVADPRDRLRACTPAERLARIWPYAQYACMECDGPLSAIGEDWHRRSNIGPLRPPDEEILRRFDDLYDRLWGTRGAFAYHEAMQHLVTSPRDLSARIRYALRTADADGDTGELTLVTARAARLPGDGLELFVALVRHLQARAGYTGTVVTFNQAIGGRFIAATARAGVVLDGRRVQIEVVSPATAVSDDRSADVTALAHALTAAGGGDIALDTRAEERSVCPGIWRWASLDPARRAELARLPAVAATARSWLGAERCMHRRATWVTDLALHSRTLACPDCYRSAIARVGMHQLPEPEFTAAFDRVDEEQYLGLERFRAAMEGLGPDTVPGTIAELRARDGIRSIDPADYAIGRVIRQLATPRAGAEQVLAARRPRR